jgi:hypothetical protein
MRVIKVVYRGIFREPQGLLNPSGLRMNVEVFVEVFQEKGRWLARGINGNPFTKLGDGVSARFIMLVVQEAFREVVEPWQTWGKPPAANEPRMLESHELEVREVGGVDVTYWKEPEDFTHIIHGPSIKPGEKIPRAACGQSVGAKCFISTKANIHPTCLKCAEVWEREYKK